METPETTPALQPVPFPQISAWARCGICAGGFLEAQAGANSRPRRKTRVIPPTRVKERPCNFAHGRFFFFIMGTIFIGGVPQGSLLRARGAAHCSVQPSRRRNTTPYLVISRPRRLLAATCCCCAASAPACFCFCHVSCHGKSEREAEGGKSKNNGLH